MYHRQQPKNAPWATIAAYVTSPSETPRWRAHPATNPNVYVEAPTMEEAIGKVRKRFASYDRAVVQRLDDANDEYVVRRVGWSEDYGYYAGEGASYGDVVQMLWRDAAQARRMSVVEAFATAALASEATLVEAWPRAQR